jgi:hypothetical protein
MRGFKKTSFLRPKSQRTICVLVLISDTRICSYGLKLHFVAYFSFPGLCFHKNVSYEAKKNILSVRKRDAFCQCFYWITCTGCLLLIDLSPMSNHIIPHMEGLFGMSSSQRSSDICRPCIHEEKHNKMSKM